MLEIWAGLLGRRCEDWRGAKEEIQGDERFHTRSILPSHPSKRYCIDGVLLSKARSVSGRRRIAWRRLTMLQFTAIVYILTRKSFSTMRSFHPSKATATMALPTWDVSMVDVLCPPTSFLVGVVGCDEGMSET